MQGAQPAITWFLHKFNVNLVDAVTAFKKAWLFDPVTARGLHIGGDTVRELRCFPFFDNAELEGLVQELPNYLAAITDVSLETAEQKLQWWFH